MKKVDLNVDIGEGFPDDEALLEFATSANICCGEHAGSEGLTHHTWEMCRERGVRIGAHPGFPDRESMGRRIPSIKEMESYGHSVVEQVRRLPQFEYVKPHGAFYNLLVDRAGLKSDLCKAAWDAAIQYYESGYRLMLLNDENFVRARGDHFPTGAEEVICEGFADRAYLPDGSLVPRSELGAILKDPGEIRAQVLSLAGKVESICLHGDTPNCLEFADLVKRTLVDAGYEVGY